MSELRRRSLKAIVPGAAALLVGVSALAAHASPAAAATGTVIEVQAAGPGGGPPSAPGVIPAPSVYVAETLAAAHVNQGDVTVELGTGTYRLSRPLTFTAQDAGRNGHTITWEAAPGAHPVLSGAQQVTNWQSYDASKNIWVATSARAPTAASCTSTARRRLTPPSPYQDRASRSPRPA